MFFRARSLQNEVGDPPLFYISDNANSSSFNGKIFRKKSMLENFRVYILKHWKNWKYETTACSLKTNSETIRQGKRCLWYTDSNNYLKGSPNRPKVPHHEILGDQHLHLCEKVSSSSHPKAKVSCLWHPDTSRAQLCPIICFIKMNNLIYRMQDMNTGKINTSYQPSLRSIQ